MEDDSENLAFRRVVVRVAERLTEEEVRKVIYIRLYSQREAFFRSPETLEVLAALEHAEVFGPDHPEGLLEILEKDLKNRPLTNDVKVFIRDRKRKSDNAMPQEREREAESDSRLRLCYKMAISQANVLVKHLEALRVATTRGPGKMDEATAREAVENISEAATALARLREKASEQIREVSRTNTAEEEAEQPDYEDVEVFTEEEVVSRPLPSTPPTVRAATLPPPPTRKQKPLASNPKPPLKPKPKLNNPIVWSVTRRSLPQSGFNSSQSSSLPHLLENGEEEDENEGDYICPELIDEAIDDDYYDGSQQKRDSRVLTKTTSLPHFTDENETSISFRPLPARPTDLLADRQVMKQNCRDNVKRDHATLEECEPIYDDIVEHTLLSRMGKPRCDSSSSSD